MSPPLRSAARPSGPETVRTEASTDSSTTAPVSSPKPLPKPAYSATGDSASTVRSSDSLRPSASRMSAVTS